MGQLAFWPISFSLISQRATSIGEGPRLRIKSLLWGPPASFRHPVIYERGATHPPARRTNCQGDRTKLMELFGN
jgi:hypothetical protein